MSSNDGSGRVAHSTIPRKLLDVSNHSVVNELLKDLKVVHQRLQRNIVALSSELRLLERIYYKGKNQHRAALFWRKVIEVRRICARISHLRAIEVVEELRYTFHSAQGSTAQQALKRAWKQVPSAETCMFFMSWLSTTSQMANQTRSCCRLAHQSFTQQIQTATFLPLVLALISIVSRLDFIAAELHDIFGTQWQVLQRILQILPDSDSKISNKRCPSLSNPFRESESDSPTQHRKETGLFGDVKDLPSAKQVDVIQEETPSNLVFSQIRTEVDVFQITSGDTTPLDHKSSQILEYVKATKDLKSPIIRSHISQDPSETRRTKKRKLAKTTPVNARNEIDDIFGA